jgi:hypothetical protein
MDEKAAMNPAPDCVKTCARCDEPVRLTREQYEVERDQAQTTCPSCKAKLGVEAAQILERAAVPFTEGSEIKTDKQP